MNVVTDPLFFIYTQGTNIRLKNTKTYKVNVNILRSGHDADSSMLFLPFIYVLSNSLSTVSYIKHLMQFLEFLIFFTFTFLNFVCSGRHSFVVFFFFDD